MAQISAPIGYEKAAKKSEEMTDRLKKLQASDIARACERQ